MIGTDGGLRHIAPLYSEDLKAKGWKIVVNPKRTYWPEYDQTSKFYRKDDTPLTVTSDVLEVEVL